MTCDESQQLLNDYALGLLAADEESGVRRHLGSGCELCALELCDIQTTLATLSSAIPPVAPPAQVWRNLEQHLRDAPQPLDRASATPSSQRRYWWGAYVAAGLAGLLASAAVVNWTTNSAAQRRLEARISSAQNSFPSAQVELTQLAGVTGFQQATAVLAIDAVGKELQFVAQGWPAPALGNRYALWIRDADKNLVAHADLQNLSDEGFTAVLPIPQPQHRLNWVEVTEESLVGALIKPVGPVRFAAEITQRLAP